MRFELEKKTWTNNYNILFDQNEALKTVNFLMGIENTLSNLNPTLQANLENLILMFCFLDLNNSSASFKLQSKRYFCSWTLLPFFMTFL